MADRERPDGVVPGRICYCMKVSEEEIEQAIRALGLKTVEEVTRYTRAGGGCQTCWPEIEEILKRCGRGELKFGLTAEVAERVKANAARLTAARPVKRQRP
jgi:NifU-like protein